MSISISDFIYSVKMISRPTFYFIFILLVGLTSGLPKERDAIPWKTLSNRLNSIKMLCKQHDHFYQGTISDFKILEGIILE